MRSGGNREKQCISVNIPACPVSCCSRHGTGGNKEKKNRGGIIDPNDEKETKEKEILELETKIERQGGE